MRGACQSLCAQTNVMTTYVGMSVALLGIQSITSGERLMPERHLMCQNCCEILLAKHLITDIS